MSKHEAIFTFTARSTARVTVDVPEGSTKREIRDLLEKAAEHAQPGAWEDVEITDDMWAIGEEPKSAPPDLTLHEPGEECWIEIDGHRWVTDGCCALREGSAMPTEHGCGHWSEELIQWISPADECDWQTATEGMPKMLNDRAGFKPEDGRLYHRRFAPVLAQGVVEVSPGTNTQARVVVDGETVAIVMPYVTRCEEDTKNAIHADGTPARADEHDGTARSFGGC